MRILILGAGGVGGLFGGRLACSGADVTFLVRDTRKQLLMRDGLSVRSPFGDFTVPVRALTRDELEPVYDIIVLTCKAYDLPSAIDSISPAMGSTTAVLPFLNGIEHIERLDEAFGESRVLGGTARVQATVDTHGVVHQLNDWQTLVFGERDGQVTPRLEQLKELLDRAGAQTRISSRIVHELWLKLVHLSTVAGMTCLMRGNIGEIARTPHGTALLSEFFERNARIAAHAGYAVDDAFRETYLTLFRQTDSRYEASMLRDLEKGGQIEADHILGYMLRRCQEAGVPQDLHLAAYTHAKTFEQRRDAARLPR